MPRTFLVSRLFEQLEIAGEDLVTREYGQKAYLILREELRLTPERDFLVLDFTGVRVLDTSFARESVFKLLEEVVAGHFGESRFILANVTESTFDNLDTMMRRRYEKKIFLIQQPAGLEIAGHPEPNLEEVLALLKLHKELTARELADSLGLEVNTASTRLKKLHDLGVTIRHEEVTESGRQHVYRLLGV